MMLLQSPLHPPDPTSPLSTTARAPLTTPHTPQPCQPQFINARRNSSCPPSTQIQLKTQTHLPCQCRSWRQSIRIYHCPRRPAEPPRTLQGQTHSFCLPKVAFRRTQILASLDLVLATPLSASPHWQMAFSWTPQLAASGSP
ncbi:hypothetical protein Mapa_005958 [Marchantia paleacea]|nr:hypothetical protein Mapa_005958 [Marchantia paleacea]